MTKRIAFVLIVTLGLMASAKPLFAYYDDVHYALTYYIAREVGYTPEQAYRIASADVSVDKDFPTEPVQASTVIQALGSILGTSAPQEARWRFHAFRNEIRFKDAVGNGANGAAADTMISQQRTALYNAGVNAKNLGVFLHFFQDQVPHAKYGTAYGHWPVVFDSDTELAERNDLPIGGSTDWLSFRPIESNLDLVQQTASVLKIFMARVSPHQKALAINGPAMNRLLQQLRGANVAPAPLNRQQIEIIQQVKTYGMDIGRLANQANLSVEETQAIVKHLNGPAFEPAIERINDAMAQAHWSTSGQGPFETVPADFRAYPYDSLGNLERLPTWLFSRPSTAVTADQFVLSGTLRINLFRPQSAADTPGRELIPRRFRIAIRLAKTRPSDDEYLLNDPSREQPIVWGSGVITVFNDLPVGELVVEVLDDANGMVVVRQNLFLLSQQKSIDITPPAGPSDVAPSSNSSTGPQNPPVGIPVNGVKPGKWVDTGIKVKKGQEVTITVTGQLNWPGGGPFGPGGYQIPGGVAGYIASFEVGDSAPAGVANTGANNAPVFQASETAPVAGDVLVGDPRCWPCLGAPTDREDKYGVLWGSADGTIQGSLNFVVQVQ